MVGWEKVTLPKQYRGLGVRVARAANTVWLGKLVWDMHRKPTKLWVSVLPHKYLKNEQFLDSHHRNDSPIWTSISKTKKFCVRGIILELEIGVLFFGMLLGSLMDPFLTMCLLLIFMM